MSLTDTKVRNAKPQEKAYKLFDEKGLFLLITPQNQKYWRLKYRFTGKEKSLALGVYPETTLANARDKRDDARKLLANDIDPGLSKQLAKRTARIAAANTFQTVALEWFAKFSPNWEESTRKKTMGRLENDLFPWLGSRPVMDIKAVDLLPVLRRVEDRGALDAAHRLRQYCSKIFLYAVSIGLMERDPTYELRGALPPVKVKHFATITKSEEIGALLRAIDGYQGHFITKCALRLIPLLMVRTVELRMMEWSEINFETAEWRIPGPKMKMRGQHIVPLPTQAISILRELEPLTGQGVLAFPSVRTTSRPISDNTILSALRRMGYGVGEMTGHGFRSMASTLLNEQGWNRDAIERQLSHVERNSVRAAYNYAEYLPERRKMMQHWADYLDELKNSILNVISQSSTQQVAAAQP